MTKIRKLAKYIHKNKDKLHTRQDLMRAMKVTKLMSSNMGGNWVGNYLLKGIKGGLFYSVGKLGQREVFAVSKAWHWTPDWIEKVLGTGKL